MRSDIFIGLAVSIVAHVGFLYGERLIPDRPPPPPPKKEEVIELIEMPQLEPEEPEVVESTEAETSDIVDLAPPSIMDVPTTVPVNAFVQPVQPPPPPGMTANTGSITIPVGRPQVSRTGLTNVFNLADLDQKPAATFQAQPVYPFEMRRAGISGEVRVGFIVDTTGAVRDAYVVSSTQREFEAPAVQAVMKWRFRPGKRGGRPVNTRMEAPISFKISDE